MPGDHPMPVLALDLSAEALALSVGSQSATLPLGWARMGSFVWPREPKASDIERAIDHIENALESVVAWASQAESAGLNAEAFALVLSSMGSVAPAQADVLTRDEVEAAFRLWAEAAQGGVTARQQRPDATPQGDAVLLLLREITHHWDMSVMTKRA